MGLGSVRPGLKSVFLLLDRLPTKLTSSVYPSQTYLVAACNHHVAGSLLGSCSFSRRESYGRTSRIPHCTLMNPATVGLRLLILQACLLRSWPPYLEVFPLSATWGHVGWQYSSSHPTPGKSSTILILCWFTAERSKKERCSLSADLATSQCLYFNHLDLITCRCLIVCVSMHIILPLLLSLANFSPHKIL